ncbi:MAG TPA: folate-binding protein [Terricaulis sp.]|nr:folate-binding protein [Terricaulis sp.]
MPFRLDRAFIRVSGPDAVSFLDNLLTQDVTKIDAHGVLYAALLSPQGKIITDMFVWDEKDRGEPSLLLELDPSRAENLLRRLTMYKLRAQVTLADVSGEVQAVFDQSAFSSDLPDPRFTEHQLGWRDFVTFPIDFADGAAAYEAHRLALGVPDLARDCAPEEVFAGEALLEELNGVDFHKGCFVGQENTSRMKRRATTRKKFCPIVFEGPAPAYDAVISAGAAEIGRVRTGGEGRAIALLRLDRALAAAEDGVQLTAEGREIRLDPPDWLILPQREAPRGGGAD